MWTMPGYTPSYLTFTMPTISFDRKRRINAFKTKVIDLKLVEFFLLTLKKTTKNNHCLCHQPLRRNLYKLLFRLLFFLLWTGIKDARFRPTSFPLPEAAGKKRKART